MSRPKFQIMSGSTGSYSTYGFWYDEKPSISTAEPAYTDLLVSIPYSDKQLDFSRIDGNLHYPNGRDFEYVFRKVKRGSEDAIVNDVKDFKNWLTSLRDVQILDTWSGRAFNNCTVTSVDAEFENNLGWQARVTVQVHSLNAKDIGGNV